MEKYQQKIVYRLFGSFDQQPAVYIGRIELSIIACLFGNRYSTLISVCLCAVWVLLDLYDINMYIICVCVYTGTRYL